MDPGAPSIDALTHHLAQCPPDFLGNPRTSGSGEIHLDAVVYDLCRGLGYAPDASDLVVFRPPKSTQRNWAATVLIGCWLAYHPSIGALDVGKAVYKWLRNGLGKVAGLIAAGQFVENPDRREELARLMMRELGVVPAGETADQAADRLSTVDSVERARVLRETKAQRERAEKLRAEMAAQRAREAAAKYSRE